MDIISEELHRTRRSFVKIGWYLKHIREKEMYKKENYTNIYELAADKFNLSQPTATRFMNICEQFSIGHNLPELDEQYIDFSMSQLFEMLPMKQEEMSQITSDMTITQIRDFKKKGRKPPEDENQDIPGQTSIQDDFKEFMPDDYKKEVIDVMCREVSQESKGEAGIEDRQRDPKQEEEIWQEKALSAYGFPKTVYPKGTLLTTEGCGNFMRMKEDHMLNGQLKPAYNVQITIENYFIIHTYISNDRTDYNTLIPVLEKHKAAFGTFPEETTADSGYCSEKNLLYLKEKGITSYIKLQDHEKRKTRAYTEDIGKYYNMKSMIYEDEHYYVCHDGRKLRHIGTETKQQEGYVQTFEVYGCSDCGGCEHKAK